MKISENEFGKACTFSYNYFFQTEIEMVNKVIPGTHLDGQNELAIKDSSGGVLWKKSFEIGSNDDQVSLIFFQLINSFLPFKLFKAIHYCNFLIYVNVGNV